MKYYAVADVHGFLTPLREALTNAGFFDDTEPHRLVVCGDLLDRGKEAVALVDFLLELAKKGELVYILGNHEDLLVQCLQEIARGEIDPIASGMSHHAHNGTWNTLLQLSGMNEVQAYENPEILIREVRNSPFYRELLPLALDYLETDHYIFTHGYLPCVVTGAYPYYSNYRYDPEWRSADWEGWRRARWFNGMKLNHLYEIREPEKTVVCGHFHASYGHAVIERKGSEFGADADFTPYYGEGIIAIDACTAASGTVNVVVLKD